VFYLIGACSVAAAWNKLGASYIAGIFFAEQFFVAFHAATAAIDFWRKSILNAKKWRTLIYHAMFLFLAVIDFFAFAVTSTSLDSDGVDNAGPALLALFYFLVLIPQIVYLIIYLVPKLNAVLSRPTVLCVLAGSFSLCCFVLLIAYFVVTGNAFYNEFTGKGYFVGFGFFVLMTGAVIATDMFLERFIPGFQHQGGGNKEADIPGAIRPVDSY